MSRHLLLFTNLARSSTIRSIKLPRLSCNLQPHHLGNYFPRIRHHHPFRMTFTTMNLLFLLMGPATDEKSFAVNHHSDNTLELFIINPALLIFEKIGKPTPSRFISFTFIFLDFPSKCFQFLDNYIDAL